MNKDVYLLIVACLMGAITFFLRAIPFVAARFLTRHKIIDALGAFLPSAIMTLLLIHTFNGLINDYTSAGLREFGTVFLVLILQWQFKKAMLSIFAGTALYVFLLNFV